MKKAVCLLSGGLDSCVAAYIAKNEGYEIFSLNFTYGQRHYKERDCAVRIADQLKVRRHLTLSVPLDRFGGSSLLESSKKNIPTHSMETIGDDIPSTYVPARNTVFLSLGLSWAEGVDADAVFIGANVVDYSGYPDCRPEFIHAFQHVADVGTKKGVEGRSVAIIAPLLEMSKTEIIKKGSELDVPFDLTWSCYQGSDKACGRCDSCLLRLRGFQDVGLPDPITYRKVPSWYTQ